MLPLRTALSLDCFKIDCASSVSFGLNLSLTRRTQALGFWEKHWGEHEPDFLAMMKDLQKGTRILQAICCEGKSRKDRATVTKVPALKRTLERFIFRMKAFFHGTEHFGNFWVGNLKHKNLRGEEVASQAEPDVSDAEMEEEEDEEEAEDEGEADGGEDGAYSDGEY